MLIDHPPPWEKNKGEKGAKMDMRTEVTREVGPSWLTIVGGRVVGSANWDNGGPQAVWRCLRLPGPPQAILSPTGLLVGLSTPMRGEYLPLHGGLNVIPGGSWVSHEPLPGHDVCGYGCGWIPPGGRGGYDCPWCGGN